MEVVLVSHTPEPEKLVASAARLCYSKSNISEIIKNISVSKIEQRIKDCYKKGHLSVFEHVTFTFGVEGISRIATHQLVRHRIASFSQQSQRYVNLKEGASFIVPNSIKNNAKAYKAFVKHLENSEEIYGHLVDNGIESEDARFVFPQAVETKLLLTMNARELFHFFNLRCCKHSQWEIRSLAYRMLSLAKKASHIIFENAGPFCFSGKCPENDVDCFERTKNGRVIGNADE